MWRLLRGLFSPHRPDDVGDRVLDALQDGPLTTAALCKRTHLATMDIYPAIFRLERSHLIDSAWADGPAPRKRVYWLKREPA